VVVLVAQTADQRIGLVVDDVETIYTTLADQIASPSFRIDPGIVPYLRGAVERNGEFVRLLHGERLLLGEQMQQFS
jgi:chemotaxis signal transduction protein